MQLLTAFIVDATCLLCTILSVCDLTYFLSQVISPLEIGTMHKSFLLLLIVIECVLDKVFMQSKILPFKIG